MIRYFRFLTLFAALAIGGALLAPAPAEARSVVKISTQYAPGTIIVRTGQRRLYYVTARGKAISYRVGVGRAGRQWSGNNRVARKVVNPAWINPYDKKRKVIPPGPRNPLGVRALVLAHGQYAIHGTNNPGSIGGAVSLGCIRMYNQDVLDLYSRARVGARVIVTR
ncbi:MAG: L,D-transpeptidase [Rhodobiaceae bacterium]|nr:L,D-transpeptidase [Rhodobiaceae bacterium]MCC0012535.1 L,D-transpeptidase [Rhodobiaceae bacterium]MCC0050679.1 L,D-transpeptidase [Rhodobiaceae bacterium]MCC0061742.1 L,D-transpeptidase [Rhodobiaceae bacterium]